MQYNCRYKEITGNIKYSFIQLLLVQLFQPISFGILSFKTHFYCNLHLLHGFVTRQKSAGQVRCVHCV